MERISNYINGHLKSPVGGSFLHVFNPSSGQIYAEVPASEPEDVENAVQAAQLAFPAWSNTSVQERHDILSKIAELIKERAATLAHAEAQDTGKPLNLAAQVDIPRAAANFDFFANAITQFSSEAHHGPHRNALNYTLRAPLGVVACISPWNLPLYLITWKIAPALAAGNTVVAKPSEVTPMTAFLLSQICIEAGLPPGVLNVIHGSGAVIGKTLNVHPLVKGISFTGSTRVGAEIAGITSPLFKKVSLEMGGKNPCLIFADCDYEKMLDKTIGSSFSNQGQICLCSSRILIERSLYDRFKEDFVKRAEALRVGPPMDDTSDIGAVISSEHLNKVLGYVALGQKEGGTLLCGGNQIHPPGYEKGWYIRPAVFENLASDCRTNQEEVFGPVVTLTPFETEEEALQLANDSSYGLSATVWTRDLSRAHRLSKSINVGIVWINTWLLRDLRTPFGGMKNSGMGREGGLEALRFFTEPKNVCIEY